MSAILAVTAPFFALVLLGHLAAHSRLLPEAAIPGLNAYVLFFALPCMLFRFGASMPLAQLLDPALIGIYALAALLMVALTVTVTVRRRADGPGVDLKNAAFGAFVAAFPNSGFMGVPLLAALHGPEAAGPVIGTLLVDLFLTSTVCLALAQVHVPSGPGDAPSRGVMATVRRSLVAALSNPQPWAIAVGAVAAGAPPACPGRSHRSSGCSPIRPRRWRFSRSAACSGAPASMKTTARRWPATCRSR
jgi:predicted permease